MTLSRRPERINACPCRYCLRVGARWGYLEGCEVHVDGTTVSYRRAARALEIRRCEICGVVTHWQRPGRPDDAVMGINTSIFEAAAMLGIPVTAGY